jgi:hypothetical protein
MRQRSIVLFAVPTAISRWALPALQAQGPAPQAYSFTANPGFALLGTNAVLTLYQG